MNQLSARPQGRFWLCTAVRSLLCAVLYICAVASLRGQAGIPAAALSTNNSLFLIEGKVEVARVGTGAWAAGRLNQVLYPGDHVRTGERSRAAVYLTNGITKQLWELSELEVPPSPAVTFWKGLFKILNRGRSFDSRLPGVTAAIRG